MKSLLAVLVALVVLAVACGSDSEGGGTPTAPDAAEPEALTTEPAPSPTRQPAPTEAPEPRPTATDEAGSPEATPTPVPPTPEPVDTTASDLFGCESEIADDVPLFFRTYFRCTEIVVDGGITAKFV